MQVPLSRFDSLVGNIDLRKFLSSLGYKEVDYLLNQVKHFTDKEAEHRDEIVLDYFGGEGIERIVSAAADEITSHQPEGALTVLDVGAGIGTFTIRITKEVRRARFYALDVTPAMLRVLARRAPYITPIIGIAENIAGSIEYAQSYSKVPKNFNVVLSILTLHHCLDVKSALQSFHRVLKRGGKAIIVDLNEHQFSEFRTEMGDYHLGFKPDVIEEIARFYFHHVRVRELPRICCSSSGRSAGLFISTMRRQ